MEHRYDVMGMTCSACSAHVDKSVRKLDGVREVNVNLLSNSMVVEFDENAISDNEIIAAVQSGGYNAKIKGDKTASDEKKVNVAEQEMQNMKKRLISSLIFLIPLFYISMGHMMNFPLPSILLGHKNMMIFALTEIILTVPVMYINKKYFINGFRSLVKGSPNMDSLIAVGAGASFIYSMYSVYAMAYYMGRGNLDAAHGNMMDLYFESAAMILTLITFGKFLETRSKGKTSEAIAKLLDLAPKQSRVVRDGKTIMIDTKDVIAGDTIIVKSGENVPVDGIIIEGNAQIDESALTGESLPVNKMPGDTVISASSNITGYFTMRAEKVGEDTTLSQIVRLVEEASSSKAPISRLADKVSGVFVPIVIGIAIVTLIVWMLLGYSFGFAVSVAVAVLVISCPCALGLATPTAIMVGTGRGAAEGILIKDAKSLETLHSIDTVVLDKTGTVTKGKLSVTDIYSKTLSKKELIKYAASIEVQSEHPLAAAIEEYAKDKGISLYEATDYKATEGQGIEGIIEGERILAGNSLMMTENGIDISAEEKRAAEYAREGKTTLYFAKGNKVLGIVALADVIKETSKEAIASLKDMGIEVIMMTGDNDVTARAIADQVGIDNVLSQVLPQDKEGKVRELINQGKKTAMIGDGINDAPALARADVGIAIGQGTDIAIESADVVLMKSDLKNVGRAITFSKKTMRNVKENLFWAFFYNVLGIPVAAGVLYIPFGIKLNPMIGAAAMSFSSVFVVSNALRLRFFKSGRETINKTNEVERKEEKNMTTKTIIIDGMMCGHCTARVESALSQLEGASVKVSLDDKSATVTMEEMVSDEKLEEIIDEAGYKVVEIRG